MSWRRRLAVNNCVHLDPVLHRDAPRAEYRKGETVGTVNLTNKTKNDSLSMELTFERGAVAFVRLAFMPGLDNEREGTLQQKGGDVSSVPSVCLQCSLYTFCDEQ